MNKKSHFKLISLQNEGELLKKLNEKYREEFNQSFFDKDESYKNQYLCYIHEDLGLIGGAKVMPQDIKKPLLEGYFSDYGYNIGKFWQLSHIFFSPPSESDIQQNEEAFNLLCQEFYQDLRLCLFLFGNEKEIPPWVVVSNLEEHENAKYFGEWDYEIEHKFSPPHAPEEIFVLGCLKNNLQIGIKTLI